MADLQENLEAWGADYDWSRRGDEWSESWGDTQTEWWGSIVPRIRSFVPAATILEIAPGYGRWTQFLRQLCGRLIIVDLAERCIDHCRARFSADAHIEYVVNDGRSLDMIEDGSIDFAFSFDSLVHAEADVIEAYLAQLAKKLKPDGAAFLHHSNAGAYTWYYGVADRIWFGRGIFRRVGLLYDNAWRAPSVTAATFAAACTASGLQCVSQELVNWESGPLLTDCLSVVTPFGSPRAHPNRVIRNRGFMREAGYLRRIVSTLYASP